MKLKLIKHYFLCGDINVDELNIFTWQRGESMRVLHYPNPHQKLTSESKLKPKDCSGGKT
jgi:hypothetical protein